MATQESLRKSPLLGILLVFSSFVSLGCQSFQDDAMRRRAESALDAGPGEILAEDSLHLLLCGTGSPLPSERAGPCTAVVAGGHFFLIDVGPGATRSLGALRMPVGSVDGVFITHFHSDHIAELGEIGMQSWALGRPKPLPVYGPYGIEGVTAGFDQAYADDSRYREAHHGREWMAREDRPLEAPEVPTPPAGTSALAFDDGKLRVSVFRVDHEPVRPAVGYRFEYGGRTVVVTGDTKKSESVVANAKGADLLVLTHLVPAPDGAMAESIFLRGVDDAWDGEVVIGEDGMLFSLPGGSEEIVRRRL